MSGDTGGVAKPAIGTGTAGEVRRRTRWRAAGQTTAAHAATVPLAGVGAQPPSVLDPRGPRAADIAQLWWIMLVLAVAIFAIVMVLLLIALFRPRRDEDAASAGPPGGRFYIPVAGIALPAIILIALFALTLRSLGTQGAPAAAGDLTVEVVGHQWWWEARYPGQDVVSANEIHIPAGEPVRMLLTSSDVIHSFWVPELAGKLDLIPGQVNEFWLEADAPGVYFGECAEFCGIQHARMAFHVVADAPREFASWLEAQRQPAAEPPADSLIAQGQGVLLSSGCIQCHTVKGTQATGQLGPDLTHLSSRRAIAAGTLDNTVGNLAAWVADPQAIKPGAKMPPTPLDADELQALIAYLQSLD
jgi:cytochrome c oxidase subunit 2